MVRVVLYLGFVLLVVIAIRSWLRGPKLRRRQAEQVETMVFDPACSTYIPSGKALTRRINGDEYRFCSRECAEAFLQAKTANTQD